MMLASQAHGKFLAVRFLLCAVAFGTAHAQTPEIVPCPLGDTATVHFSFVAPHAGASLRVNEVYSRAGGVTWSQSDTLFRSSSDTIRLTCRFLPTQAVRYPLTVVATAESALDTLRLVRSAYVDVDAPGTTWDFLFDLEGEALKRSLSQYLNGHTSLSYNAARDYMFTVLDMRPGDTLECFYSGKKIQAANRSEAQAKSFNTEHTWPQSLGASAPPAQSDMHHLAVTDEVPNARRGNFPFGEVTGNVTYESGGSRLGSNGSTTVFEPRAQVRGNVARAMMYFALRYGNPNNFLNNQETVLRKWHRADPPDSLERRRTALIADKQFRRNPLVERPEIIDRMAAISTNADMPSSAELAVWAPPARVSEGDTARIAVICIGSRGFSIDSITVQHQGVPVTASVRGDTLRQGNTAEILLYSPALADSTGRTEVTIAVGGQSFTAKADWYRSSPSTGIPDEAFFSGDEVRVWPNPATDYLTVAVPATLVEPTAELVFVDGKSIPLAPADLSVDSMQGVTFFRVALLSPPATTHTAVLVVRDKKLSWSVPVVVTGK